MHHALKSPVIKMGEELKTVTFKVRRQEHVIRFLNWETPLPPTGWKVPGFDDSGWLRGVARRSCMTPYLAQLCLRGKFTLTDPKQVKDLRLSLAFRGGAIVYVNGQEVIRAHVQPETPGQAYLAEPYPREAFLSEENVILGEVGPIPTRGQRAKQGGPGPETLRRLELRTRILSDVAIPQSLLRPGTNVLAIEIIRAPYHQVIEEMRQEHKKKRLGEYQLTWNTCEIRWVRLTAASTEGLIPNATRPQGLQVWNSDLLLSDFDMDFGDRTEPVQPIRITGVRNGFFSGKVVVGSTNPIKKLRVTATELAADGMTIPASTVQIRYAAPWGREEGVWGRTSDDRYAVPRYPRQPKLLGRLDEAPLDSYAVSAQEPGLYDLRTPGELEPVFGAVVPVWVTVKVPKNARAGTYKGKITILVENEQPLHVPVHLKVLDWALPDPQDYRTWMELVQSPDTLAVEYKTDLWSERHWQLIAKSMRFQHEIGSRVLHIPLICYTNYGNEQSMVRWIRKGENEYEYDFSIMEKYLDTAQKHMGKPKIVKFDVWDVYMIPQKELKMAKDGTLPIEVFRDKSHARWLKTGRKGDLKTAGQNKILGSGPAVTILDPATKECQTAYLPPHSDAASKAQWQPLFSELHKRMKRRGLQKAMMLGNITDARPNKAEAQFFHDLAPGLPWVSQAHFDFDKQGGYLLHKTARVAYQVCVRGATRFAVNDPKGLRRYGWKNPELFVEYERCHVLQQFAGTRWRHLGELNISGGQRGVGRIGADFWKAIRDKHGRRLGTVTDRYPQSGWRYLNIYTAVLAPGPDGPVATSRFEYLREGIQECEARIFIERALTDQELKAKLGADLLRRCEEAFEERYLYMWTGLSNLRLRGWYGYAPQWDSWRWFPPVAGHHFFVGSAWQQRTEKLFALAVEVAKATGE